ncbi:hypothetical protein [Pedobacter agri]|uniref:DUF5678 domain-containing protein n=1 Tax=Pedobacter agri TaxID=454586 RepID=A0A9X3IAZ3_9SPHI|nr:hypothetical protein [Pedobacter agri]MCX3266534.1 hypothetical protein [Pedobacter agri]
MLEKEFKYYLDHQKELVQKYNNRFVVIRGDQVVGDYASQSDAYNASSKQYELGTFLIQHCTSGLDGHTQTFHSRVFLKFA